MAITLETIKELRAKTGAGIGNVKEALEASKGDFEKALLILREKGLAKAVKRAGKRAENGYILSYIHGDGSLGILLELNSETDFASKGPEFRNLAKEIALQIAACSPEYISIANVPQEIIEREETLAKQDMDPKKPAEIVQKIIDGRMQKFYQEFVLLEQKYFKDEAKLIKDLINDTIVVLGEKIEVGRFVRFVIGSSATTSNL
jgi:elongation factor Ts